MEHQVGGVAASVERDHRQFLGDVPQADPGQRPPFERRPDRRHDRVRFLFQGIQHEAGRFMLEIVVDRNWGDGFLRNLAERGQSYQRQAAQKLFHLSWPECIKACHRTSPLLILVMTGFRLETLWAFSGNVLPL